MSLKYLFGIVAFCAVITWCANQLGYANPFFWITFAFCLLLVGCYYISFKKGSSATLVAVGPVFVLISCVFSPLILFVTGSCWVFLLIARQYVKRKEEPSVQLKTSLAMGCIAGSCFLYTLPLHPHYYEVLAMRADYPFVSIEDRLSVLNHKDQKLSEKQELSQHVLNELEFFELEDSFLRRKYSLEKIHNDQYLQFIRSNGFGYVRMIYPRREFIEAGPIQNIPLKFSKPANDNFFLKYIGNYPEDFNESSIDRMHSNNINNFLNPNSFGYIAEPKKRVAGFIPHAFHYTPLLTAEETERWEIQSLQLVSLLKYDTPQVYVLDHLPRMDQLSEADVETRELDPFEVEALQQLWTEKDLVIQNNENHYRMLGSLRASKKCMQCHDVERGTLLGAFTYDLLIHGSPSISQQ